MIHLYTQGSGLILEERPIEFIQSYVNRYSQRGLGLIPTWRPMVYFWEDLKKTFIFVLICYSKLKNKLIDMYKKVYNEIPNFMYWNGTYTYVEAHVLFYKTWLIVLLTDARFENSLKVLKEFSVQRKTVKKEERELYSLIFERPL